MASVNAHCPANNTAETDTSKYRILAVYKFVQPKLDPERLPDLKRELEDFCRAHFVRGSLLLAPEGINGTIDYPLNKADDKADDGGDDPVLQKLQTLFPGLRTRISYSPEGSGHVFYRFKVKLKPDILTCHAEDSGVCLDPTRQVGTYVPPGPEWNALLEDPDCLVVDARNDYEVLIGTFRNAHNPHTETFSELLPWMQQQLQRKKPRKVAMFCTGGIRCEKASAACLDFVRQHCGGNEGDGDIPVYHLEGGILAYLDTVPLEESLFEGDCYVFDQRVAVTHGLQPSPAQYSMCHACRAPLMSDVHNCLLPV